MKAGLYISGIGHGALIMWLLLAEVFSASQPKPVEVVQVSIVSGQEFAALSAPAAAPSAEVAAPAPPVPGAQDAPAVTPAPETAPDTATPPDVTAPAPDVAPDVSSIAPLPRAEVTDVPPTPPAPPSADDSATIVSEPAAPRPTPRVAPAPAPPPAPDARIDETVTQATTPSPDAATPAPPVDQASAPEAATTEIVTEADQGKAPNPVMRASIRPRARPARHAPPAATPPPANVADAVANAVADAVAGGPAPTSGNGSAPVGPPLTSGEKDALRLAVQSCWVVDPGAAAARVTVTVGISMGEDGKVESGSLKLISGVGGDDLAVQTAFDSARRAILRCQKGGYDLPIEKYAQWRDIEITFDPSKMRN